ncbi:MAG: permease-like cell division protein FtsX [Gemmatimonadaceae bacterium]
MRAISTALSAFRRAPLLSFLSVTTIAFSLFAFGLFALVALNINAALDQVEERVEIRAFLDKSIEMGRAAGVASEIADYPEVLKVDLVTRDMALERARRELGEFKDVFESDFLPASLDVKLRPGYRTPAVVKNVATRLRQYEFIEDVRFGEEWIAQLYKLRNIAGIVGLGLGIAFATVAIIIIGATIRMAMLSRAKEISIMQLVGATDGYIRRPFLIEGATKGLAGGALALAMSWGAMQLVQRYLNFQTVFFDARTALIGVAVGLVIGLFGSAISVGRHLRAGA